MAFATVVATVAGMLAAVSVAAAPASAATPNPTPAAGARRSATRLNFTISGTASLSVDVATGNALFTDQLLTMPGINASLPITLSYNSSVWGTSTPSAVTGDTGSGWVITGFDQRLVSNADGSVTFYGPGGLSGVFASNGAGGYLPPPQYQADLVSVSGGGWTLTDHLSQTKLTFDASGRLTKSADRNANTTTFTYDGSGYPSTVISTRGATTTRTLTIDDPYGQILSLSQNNGTRNRTVYFGYSYNGHLQSVTDTVNGLTSFSSGAGTDTGQVVAITSPVNATTTLTFSAGKVTSVAQSNATGAGTSKTRLAYPSSSQTQVADPTTNQGLAVSAVPNTTYNLTTDGSQLVSSAVDPNGHTRSATYTTLGQVKTQTPAAGGTTTYSYGANSGESLTSVATPGGATGSAGYTNSGASAYLPTSTTDDANNTTKYTYDGAGNQATTAQATGPQAKLTRNTPYGQVITSQSPGAAAGVQTTYSYDASTHNLTGITPPSGTSLGSRAYIWDGFGRLATASDGNGNTITYTYDDADRITKVDYSDAATTDVTYSYDANGHVKTRTEASGTTTYSWDDLGHLLSVADTAGGGTISYTYDLAGDLATETDAHGTTTYRYDSALQLSYMLYPQSGGTTAMILFGYDNAGRRTDSWLQTNADHSTWNAHTQTGYDSSGRVTSVLSQRGPATGPTSVINLSYCYAAGTTPAGGCTTSASTDRSNIQWVKDAVSGEATAYTYDDHARLTKAVITGGTNPRTYTYSYDAAGNRLTAAVTGTSPTSQTLTYNAANQITSSGGWAYDGAGNRTHDNNGFDYEYNTAGQLDSSGNTSTRTSYTYAGSNQNELTQQTTTGADTYQYAYGRTDQNGLPEIEAVTRIHGTTTDHAYVEHDNTGLPVLLTFSTGTVGMYVYDGQNNPLGITTNFATTAYMYSFDPYGTATTTQNAGGAGYPQNPFVFGGGLQDRTTGHIKYGQRWYDPTTGSWTQQDALNAPLDPANANRYEYASDNPVDQADPTGALNTGQAVGLGIAAVGVGVATLSVFGLAGLGGLGFLAGTLDSFSATAVGGVIAGGIGAVAGGITAAVSSIF